MSHTLYERILDPSQPPVIVAEAGINHNGDMDLARRLVIEAAGAGADVVKFQTHLPEHEMVREGPTAGYVGEPLYDLLSRMVISPDEHRDLMELAAAHGCQFMSTPFSKKAADLLDEIGVPMFKIGSGEATNTPLLRHIAGKGKPMIVSTGMTSLDEVDESVEAIRTVNSRLVLMHCTSTYPTAYRDVRLRAIGLMRERYPKIPIGISDHSINIYTSLAAVALGVRVIEKHFTGSRTWEGPDQQVSIEPQELADLVAGSRAIHEAMQVTDKSVIPGEEEVQRMARESVVSLQDIRRGEVLDEKTIGVKRPGTGIPARDYTGVLGRRTRTDIGKDTVIRWEDVE
jgi:sialic acid synthase SpsE